MPEPRSRTLSRLYPLYSQGEGSKKDFTIGHSFRAQNSGRIQYDKSYPFSPRVSLKSVHSALSISLAAVTWAWTAANTSWLVTPFTLILTAETTPSLSCLKLFKGKIHSRPQRGDLWLLLRSFLAHLNASFLFQGLCVYIFGLQETLFLISFPLDFYSSFRTQLKHCSLLWEAFQVFLLSAPSYLCFFFFFFFKSTSWSLKSCSCEI